KHARILSFSVGESGCRARGGEPRPWARKSACPDPQKHRPQYRARGGGWPARAIGLGQVPAVDGDCRIGAGRPRPCGGWGGGGGGVGGGGRRNLDEDSLGRFRARNIGIFFQSFNSIPPWTATETVVGPLGLRGFRTHASVPRARLPLWA